MADSRAYIVAACRPVGQPKPPTLMATKAWSTRCLVTLYSVGIGRCETVATLHKVSVYFGSKVDKCITMSDTHCISSCLPSNCKVAGAPTECPCFKMRSSVYAHTYYMRNRLAVSSPDALYSPNLDSHFQFADKKPSAFSLASMPAGLTSGKSSNPLG